MDNQVLLSEQTLWPSHIGIIMDGNGRWAQKCGLPRTYGHQAGMKTAKRIIDICVELDIKALTLYAFSTENWNRPKQEVEYLMTLMKEYAGPKNIAQLKANDVRLNVFGQKEGLPFAVQQALQWAIRMTKDNTGLRLNLAINYGGRAEIVNATRGIAKAIQHEDLNPDMLDEFIVDQYLYTTGIPDLDLIIRTGGEVRLSNFLIWQAVDSYFWVTDTYWPDFNRDELLAAMAAWRQETLYQGEP